jgi:L-arabinose isomerase
VEAAAQPRNLLRVLAVRRGAHHTAFSQAVTSEMLEDFATIADIEFLSINEATSISAFKSELRNNEVFYALNRGFAI